ncbi:hypothetical protein HKD37_10G028436 [Glycine soja]
MCSVEDCLEEQASQGSSIPNGCQDLLIAAIGRLEHPDRIQSQGLALPPEPEVGPLVARVSTKGSCVDPSLTDPDTGDFNKCGLYIEENPSRLVALGRVYEGSTTVHNIPLLHGHGKLVLRRLKMQRLPFLYSLTRHLIETSMRAGILMCMDSLSHSPFRDLGNRNLNKKVT